MKIAIIGGGNIGTQFAVHCSAKNHQTIIYTSKPKCFSQELTILDEQMNKVMASTVDATDNVELACKGASVIFVTLPAFMMADIAKKMLPFVNRGAWIGLIPGTGGGECAFKPYVDKGCVVFGIQRVPSVARLYEYGKSVKATGYRTKLHLAAIPNGNTQECCNLMETLFDIPCQALPNYLNVTLTPSNPILHTSRLFSLFKDYQEGVVYDEVPLFYEEWSDDASSVLFQCDEEVQNLCKAIGGIDLSYVKSLRLHYESETIEALTAKLRSISSLKGIPTPTKKIDGKYMPDFDSRYFTADFPYGLSILVQIAEFFEMKMPMCKNILLWYYGLQGTIEGHNYKKIGITNKEEFQNFYLQ